MQEVGSMKKVIGLAVLLSLIFIWGMGVGYGRCKKAIQYRVDRDVAKCTSIAMPCKIPTVGIVAYPMIGVRVMHEEE
jgi:hypothetical protein